MFDQVMQDAAKELGYNLRESTPEEVQAFDKWLSNPQNKARWDKAIREAQESLRDPEHPHAK